MGRRHRWPGAGVFWSRLCSQPPGWDGVRARLGRDRGGSTCARWGEAPRGRRGLSGSTCAGSVPRDAGRRCGRVPTRPLKSCRVPAATSYQSQGSHREPREATGSPVSRGWRRSLHFLMRSDKVTWQERARDGRGHRDHLWEPQLTTRLPGRPSSPRNFFASVTVHPQVPRYEPPSSLVSCL